MASPATAAVPRRIEVMGVPVDCVTMASALERVDAMVAGERPGAVLAVNPEKVMQAADSPELLRCLRQAALLIPDGIGVVWALRLFGGELVDRVPGAELMPAVCELAARKGYTVFLYGARPEVNQAARDELCRTYPGLKVVGARDGYVTPAGMPALVEEINRLAPQILFVALGSPRQELWMERYLPQLDVRVCQGVGGTFDVLAGRVKRAPLWFRRHNLEWFYRLLTEPRRAIRQLALPRFVFRLLRARLSGHVLRPVDRASAGASRDP
jgi:N-acetylglucosaminyldiphosphoundecaprenol N-acetyl-beta-D-mannosaminyltransferase